MKLIVAGSRVFEDLENCTFVLTCMLDIFDLDPEVIVSGCATGIDKMALNWADENDYKCKKFPVKKGEWARFGAAAGPMRNRKMADYADALLLIWDGKSRGSANMKSYMETLKKPIFEVVLKNTEGKFPHKYRRG